MSQEFDAIYTHGHLVPLGPVNLREREKVRVQVTSVDAAEADGSTPDLTGMTLHEALLATGLLGAVREGPADLSTNPKYLEGFGEHHPSPD